MECKSVHCECDEEARVKCNERLNSQAQGMIGRIADLVVTEGYYPDGNPKTAQGAKKRSLRHLPAAALAAVCDAFADGVAKYGPANWRKKGVSTTVYIDAALRHIALYYDGGEKVASDSKAHHLGHAMACLAIIIDAEAAGSLNDDRPDPMPGLDKLLHREA